MSGLAGLDLKIINAITGNLPVSDLTRAELRNFLQGRITTASNLEEFTDGLDRLISEIEVGSTEPIGTATGEILGALEGGAVVALEGGIIVGKGLEIAGELSSLRQHTQAEQDAINRMRDQIQRDLERGVIHGGEGNPTRDIEDLIRQRERQRQRGRQKAGEEKKGDITFDDPRIQRGQPVEDVFGDGGESPDIEAGESVDIDILNADTFSELEAVEQQALLDRAFEDAAQAAREGRVSPRIRDRLADIRALGFAGLVAAGTVQVFLDVWKDIRRGGGGDLIPIQGERPPEEQPPEEQPREEKPPRKTDPEEKPPRKTDPEGQRPAEEQKVPEFVRTRPVDAGEDIDKPQGEPLLRPEFLNVGTDFFDKMYDTPMSVQNSEWAEFDFVSLVDRNNGIELDNVLGQKIRFQAPLYYPKVQKPLAPPTKESIALSKIPMRREIQLSQPYMPKFDGADMGRPMEFTTTYNHSPFDFNFLNLKLYNPV